MDADFIIVGAGSAGCAMAYRLSQDRANKVLVIEFGGSDAGPFIQMPAALSYPMNMKTYDWGFQSAPEPHLGGRRLAVPRGKVIGGSSSINGMVYVRGHARDLTIGTPAVQPAGAMVMCCPISNAWRTGTTVAMAVIRRGGVLTGLCM